MVKKIVMWIIITVFLITFTQAGKVNYTMKLSCNSNSMYPAINCTNKLIVNVFNKNIDKPIIGEIYCYATDRRIYMAPAYFYICHRLVYIENDKYIFSGDNNGYDDPPVELKYIHIHIIKITNFGENYGIQTRK
jgi:signal peptidase I